MKNMHNIFPERLFSKRPLTQLTAAFALGLSVYGTQALAFDTDEIKNDQTPLYNEFTALDTSGDGLLNGSEAAKDKTFTSRHFKRADVDHDGTLDKNEYAEYKTAVQQKQVKRVASDSLITTKAKAEILRTEGLKTTQISVKTYKGEVILSGFVDSAAAKSKAEEVVGRIDGVKSVKNSLEVKS